MRQLADRYFEFIAQCFPVMCASDEFHFLPRAEKAADHYDKLDDLRAESLKNAVQVLKRFRNEVSTALTETKMSREHKIDFELLIANISGVLIEIETKGSFFNNPLLYLKIAFIGLDHALNKPSASRRETMERTSSRLHALPGLLDQAMVNLSAIPDFYYGYSISMAADCKRYLKKTVASRFSGIDRNPMVERGIQRALEAVRRFENFLMHEKAPLPDHHFSSDTLNVCLTEHFMTNRSLEDIFEIGIAEWENSRINLEKTAGRIDPDLPWQAVYQTASHLDKPDVDIISLYRDEATSISNFFELKGPIAHLPRSALTITETPLYLKTVRGSASFGASLTANENENDFFYISTGLDNTSRKAALQLVRRLHREFKFLTAHETIPGHYLLDSIRRGLDNPIRRQIESPLFYEGWATYAETLLSEYGYVVNPADLLVDYKRRLWRAARCQIDAGLSTGKLDRTDAVRLLTTTGFSGEEACRQINRFRLNPGYQLCYCLGSHEINELKKRHMHRLGPRRFYDVLLKGGELPFHWVEKRLEGNARSEARSHH